MAMIKMTIDIKAAFREALVSELHSKGIDVSFNDISNIVDKIVKNINDYDLIDGDRIVIGNYSGVVKRFGMKTAYKS